MDTAFFFPSEPVNKLTIETTVSFEKEIGEHADVFIEYVGDYPERGPSPIFLNSGGSYRAHQDGATRLSPCRRPRQGGSQVHLGPRLFVPS